MKLMRTSRMIRERRFSRFDVRINFSQPDKKWISSIVKKKEKCKRLLVTWLKDSKKKSVLAFFVFFSEEKEEWMQIVFTSPPSTPPCSRPFLNSEWCKKKKRFEFCLSFVHFSITLFL